jgi:hypothetical protein
MPNALAYRLNEFGFNLPPADVLDASINILKFPELGTSLIVSRCQLSEGETLRGSFDEQLKRLEQQVEGLRCQPVQAVLVGGEQGLEALELHSQFSRGADKVFQYQLMFVLPGTRQMLALSYVKAEPLGEADTSHWAAIKASLQFESFQ